jgi:hypothetical protein
MLGQLGARDHGAHALHQQGQYLEFMAGQRQRLTFDGDARLARVQGDGAALPQCAGMRAQASQQGAQTRQQLFHVEGFGQIVVGSGIHARDFFMPGGSGGKDQHRHGAALSAPGAQHAQPVAHGQAQVQHRGVEALHLAQVLRRLAIGGRLHGVAGLQQGLMQLLAQRGFVFNQQNSHALQPS